MKRRHALTSISRNKDITFDANNFCMLEPEQKVVIEIPS